MAAPNRPTTDLPTFWEERLGVLAHRAEAAREVYEDDRRSRDSAVREAVDNGMSIGRVARWALMSPTRVMQILARAEDQSASAR